MVLEQNEVNRILELAENNGIDVVTFEGNLLDNHVIYNDKVLKIGGVKPKKYLIIRETYLNCWSSCYTLTQTDCIKKFNKALAELEEIHEMAV